MHLETEELLALRDGEAAPEAAAHVRGCARCAAELEHLRSVAEGLARLPVEPPPADRWRELEARIATDGLRRRRRRAGRAAMAAILVVCAGVTALFLASRVSAPLPGTTTTAPVDDGLEELIAASQELESMLQQSTGDRVMSSQEAARIVVLEDGIAFIDARLASADRRMARPEAVQLWLDRVELLDALVQVRGSINRPPAVQRVSFQ